MFRACRTAHTLYSVYIVNLSWCQGSYFYLGTKSPDPRKEKLRSAIVCGKNLNVALNCLKWHRTVCFPALGYVRVLYCVVIGFIGLCLSLRQKSPWQRKETVMLVLCPFGIFSLCLQTRTEWVHPPWTALSPWQLQREKRCWECLYRQRATLPLCVCPPVKTSEWVCPLCSCWIVAQALIIES